MQQPSIHAPLAIVSLSDALKLWNSYEAVISIQDASRSSEAHRAFEFPKHMEGTPLPNIPAHLRLEFDDIDEAFDGFVGPSENQISDGLAFARAHAGKTLLIHCHAGQCRSTALALGVLAERAGPGHEAESVQALLGLRKIAAPNLIVLDIVDRLLSRNGSLKAAWMAHEETDDALLRLRFLRKAYYVGEEVDRAKARSAGV